MQKQIILLSTLFFVGCLIISCKKQSKTTTAIPYLIKDSTLINVDSCKNITHNNIYYNICFDTLLNDSRCPLDAICVWQGLAQARFKLSFNSQVYFINLATDNTLNYKTDTTIAGINFHLSELTPYPATTIFYPYSAYKAKIIVSN
jgi:hypothetical protein